MESNPLGHSARLQEAPGQQPEVTSDERYGQALVELIERLDHSRARLRQLQGHPGGDSGVLATRALAELDTAVEELRVTSAELRAQNLELRELATELATERQRYRELFEQAPDAYLVTDAGGTITDLNRAAADLLDAPVRRLRGTLLAGYLPDAFETLSTLQPEPSGVAEWETFVTAGGRAPVPVTVRVAGASAGATSATRWLLRDRSDRQRVEEGSRMLVRADAARTELEARVAERTEELAAANARLAALAAERARQAEDRRHLLRLLVSSQEEERRRIARELHDELGQLVTGLHLKLRSIARTGAAPEIADELDALHQLAERISRGVHEVALALRPPELEKLGLRAVLENYLADWAARSGIAADFHAVGPELPRLRDDVEITLYRVVQEALTNVLRHARAQRVGLVLERLDGRIAVILEDDGRGFDPEAPESTARLGLRGMRERVAMLDGSFSIQSGPGSGTTIFARVPDRPRTDHEKPRP